MPKIQEYQTRTMTSGAVPQGRKANPHAFDPMHGIDQAIRAGATGIDFVLQQKAQEEISNANLAFAKVKADFVNQLAEARKTGELNPDEFIQNYDNKVDSEIRSQISTPAAQQFYANHLANQRADLQVSAYKLKIALAGELATSNLTNAIKIEGATLQNNPEGMLAAIAGQDDAIDQNKDLPFEDRLKLKTFVRNELTEQAMRGWINTKPEHALKLLKSGDYDGFLTGDLKYKLEGEAEQRIRWNRQEKDRERTEAKRLQNEKDDAVYTDFLNRFDKGSVPNKDILEAPISPQLKKFLLDTNLTVANRTQKVAYDNHFFELYSRTLLPEGDPQRLEDANYIKQEVADRRLSIEGGKELLKEIAGKNTPESQDTKRRKANLIRRARQILNPTISAENPFGDPEGMRRANAWESDFMTRYKRERAKGKSDEELLTEGTPQYPNPNYLGNNINEFKALSPNEVMRDRAKQMQIDVPPGRILPGNLEMTNRPQIPDPAGNLSSFLPIVFHDKEPNPDFGVDEAFILIPGISTDGVVLSKEEAILNYHATGQQLGIFSNEKAAQDYTKVIQQQEDMMRKHPMQPDETPYQYNIRLRNLLETPAPKQRKPGESLNKYEERRWGK